MPNSSRKPEGVSSLAAYSDLFNRMLDSAFLIDPETYLILEANDASERTLEEPLEKVVGKSIVNWVSPSEQDEFLKALRVTMRRYYPRVFETSWQIGPTREKMILIEASACPLKLVDGRTVIQLIARDITFKKEADQKVQNLLIELKNANEKLDLLNKTDEMTGIFNYRHFRSELQIELQRSQRYKTPFSLLFLDIDNFKHYNDKNGHPAGDQMLREISQLIKKHTRASDLVARYGGEEFVVLSPGIDADGALILAERLRSSIATAQLPHSETQPLGCMSVSIGVASFPIDAEEMDALVDAADQAMYFSKKSGRNKVSTLEEATKQMSA